MRSAALFLLISFFAIARASESEDSLTSHIIQDVLKFAQKRFPAGCPLSVHPARSLSLRLFRNDTLYVPDSLWGYSAANDYRLQFYAGLLIFHNILLKKDLTHKPETFYRTSIDAARLSLDFIHTMEQDPILDDLMMYHFVLVPYRAARPSIIIGRDYLNDSLKFFCIQKSVLGYRCDSTQRMEWIFGEKTANYALVSCTQIPRRFKSFHIDLAVHNTTGLTVPLDIKLKFAKGDTLIRLKGFLSDTLISIEKSRSLLTVELDPLHRLFAMDDEGHRFVSREYINKHRFRMMVIALLWDLTSLFLALGLMLFMGIFLHPLNRFFYIQTRIWYALLFLCAAAVKIYLPASFFGFTLWGFVYDTTYLLININNFWIILSLMAAAALVYYIYEMDGVRMNKLDSVVKHMLAVCVVEPLILSAAIFAL